MSDIPQLPEAIARLIAVIRNCALNEMPESHYPWNAEDEMAKALQGFADAIKYRDAK